jgi:hypothetical protein
MHFGIAANAVEPPGTGERIRLFNAAVAKAALYADECFDGSVDGCHYSGGFNSPASQPTLSEFIGSVATISL